MDNLNKDEQTFVAELAMKILETLTPARYQSIDGDDRQEVLKLSRAAVSRVAYFLEFAKWPEESATTATT